VVELEAYEPGVDTDPETADGPTDAVDAGATTAEAATAATIQAAEGDGRPAIQAAEGDGRPAIQAAEGDGRPGEKQVPPSQAAGDDNAATPNGGAGTSRAPVSASVGSEPDTHDQTS
jgi:hypothetical protein